MKTTVSNKPMATIEVINEYFANSKKMSDLMAYDRADNFSKEIDALQNRNSELLHQYDWFCKPFEKDGKVGLKDVKGDILVPAIFDGNEYAFHLLSNAKATPMRKDGKSVLVKTDGSGVIISEPYDSITVNTYMPSCFYVIDNGKEGLITDMGQVLIQGVDKIDGYREGIYTFIKDGKHGLIDGENVIEAKFDEVDYSDDCYIKVRLGREWGYVLNNGEFTTDEEQTDDCISFCID